MPADRRLDPIPLLITLVHGTTRHRADSILKNAPNPRYVEPGGTRYDPAGGFSTYELGKPTPLGASAEDYARRKAVNFPKEGGPAILIIDVPMEIVDILRLHPIGMMYTLDSGEIRFDPGMGLEELLAAWHGLTKRIEIL